MAKTSGAAQLGPGAGRLDAVERGMGELHGQGAEGDEPALGARPLQGQDIVGRRAQVAPRQGQDLGAVDPLGQVAPPLGGVRGRVLEDVDELERLAERAGALAQRRGDRFQVGAGRAGTARSAARPRSRRRRSSTAGGRRRPRAAARRSRRCAPRNRPCRGRCAGCARGSGRRRRGRGRRTRPGRRAARPAGPGSPAARRAPPQPSVGPILRDLRGGFRIVPFEQAGEALQRLDAQLARPGGRVLEGVRHAEEQVGDGDLAPRGLGQQGDGQGEGAARRDEEPLQVFLVPLGAWRSEVSAVPAGMESSARTRRGYQRSADLGAGHGLAEQRPFEASRREAVEDQGGDAQAGQRQGGLDPVAHAAGDVRARPGAPERALRPRRSSPRSAGGSSGPRRRRRRPSRPARAHGGRAGRGGQGPCEGLEHPLGRADRDPPGAVHHHVAVDHGQQAVARARGAAARPRTPRSGRPRRPGSSTARWRRGRGRRRRARR